MGFQFSAKSITDLMSEPRNAGRKARGCLFIVAVEAANGSWAELDADSLEHGEALAKAWVENHNARGCSVWRVEPSGNMARKHSFSLFADNSFE